MAENVERELAHPTVKDLRDRVAARRHSISVTVGALEERVGNALDWRRHPLVMVGLAAGVGLLAARVFRRRRTPRDRLLNVLADATQDLSREIRGAVRQVTRPRPSPLAAIARAGAGLLASHLLASLREGAEHERRRSEPTTRHTPFATPASQKI